MTTSVDTAASEILYLKERKAILQEEIVMLAQENVNLKKKILQSESPSEAKMDLKAEVESLREKMGQMEIKNIQNKMEITDLKARVTKLVAKIKDMFVALGMDGTAGDLGGDIENVPGETGNSNLTSLAANEDTEKSGGTPQQPEKKSVKRMNFVQVRQEVLLKRHLARIRRNLAADESTSERAANAGSRPVSQSPTINGGPST